MRTPVATALAVLALSLVGCASTDSGADTGAGPTVSPSSPSATAPATRTGAPSTSTPRTPSASPGTTVCDEVVAGIDAFNLGDFTGTIDHFERAVPLAEAQAEAKPSDEADDLLEAVRYYADLPADDYLTASASSPDFAKYKAITLGQCIGGPTAPAPPTSSGVAI